MFFVCRFYELLLCFTLHLNLLCQICLRLILVSGKTKDFLFSPNDSAADIAQYVFEHWPEGKSAYILFFYNKINFSFLNSFLLTEWADESVSRAEILRLIYQGRFLHGNVTLGGESNAILCHSNN